jgi:hypothetical protein
MLALASVGVAFGEGSLTPPASALRDGVPVATMKTMDDVEPRTAISSLPYAITNPGSFYLTSSLQGTNGLFIGCDDVTVDLRGFSLSGDTNYPTHAIETASEDVLNVTICNGTIGDWGGWGIYAEGADYSMVHDLTIELCNQGGLLIGPNCRIDRATVSNTGGDGIRAGNSCALKDCTSQNNEGNGLSVQDCSTVVSCLAKANHATGIVATIYCTIRDCTVVWNYREGLSGDSSCRILDNNVGDNGHGYNGVGIHMYGPGNLLERNNVTANDDEGIQIDGPSNRIEGNSVIDNRTGIKITGMGNFVVRNCVGNPLNTNAVHYSIGPSNQVAQFLANLGNDFTNSNPWANIRLTEE